MYGSDKLPNFSINFIKKYVDCIKFINKIELKILLRETLQFISFEVYRALRTCEYLEFEKKTGFFTEIFLKKEKCNVSLNNIFNSIVLMNLMQSTYFLMKLIEKFGSLSDPYKNEYE